MAQMKIIEGKDSGSKFLLKTKNYFELGEDGSLKIRYSPIENPLFSIIHGSEGWVTRLLSGKRLEINGFTTDRERLVHGDIIAVEPFILLFDEVSQKEGSKSSDRITAQIKTRIKPYKEVHLLSHLEKSQKNLKILYLISRILNEISDEKTLFDRVLDAIFDEFKADGGFIIIIDEKDKKPKCVASKISSGVQNDIVSLQISHLVIQEVLSTRESLLSLNTMEDERFKHNLSVHSQQQIISAICAPIFAREEVIGMILLDTKRNKEPFSYEDLDLLTGTALQVGLALQRLRLQSVELEKKKLEDDIKAAEEVQRFLLPRETPDYLGTSIGCKYTLSQRLGGDYYDFLHLNLHKEAIIISDVSGHNMASALVMAMARSILRSLCKNAYSPSKILKRAHRIIKQDTTPGMYVTAIVGILNLNEMSFTYSGAGHNFPLYFNCKKNQIIELKTGGFPLGLLVDVPNYQEDKIYLEAGDILLLYTDGAVEAKNESGIRFGKERLIETIMKNSEVDAKDICEYIYLNITNHCRAETIQDDITLLCLKISQDYKSIVFHIQNISDRIEDALRQIIDYARERGFLSNNETEFRKVIREAFFNAIQHGNKNKSIRVFCRDNQNQMRITIGDDGKGFHSISHQDKNMNNFTQGVIFIKNSVDRLWFNSSRGNELTFEFSKGRF